METLTAFVRENAPWPPREGAEGLEGLLAAAIPANGRPGEEPTNEDEPARVTPRTDVQAVLTVLGRRERRHDIEGEILNLAYTDS